MRTTFQWIFQITHFFTGIDLIVRFFFSSWFRLKGVVSNRNMMWRNNAWFLRPDKNCFERRKQTKVDKSESVSLQNEGSKSKHAINIGYHELLGLLALPV